MCPGFGLFNLILYYIYAEKYAIAKIFRPYLIARITFLL